MTWRFPRFRPLLRRYRQEEDGTATIEFALAVPLLLMIFLASFESGILVIRSVMLEQAVDRTMRDLRLGNYPLATAGTLKREICDRSLILKDCMANITIEMTRISTSGWSMPTTNIACVDRDQDIHPVTALEIGQLNDIMLVRVCVVQDLLFPTTGIGLDLAQDSQGGFGLTAVTAFVTEPS